MANSADPDQWGGLGYLVVSALDLQAGYRGFESRSGRDNFQTISRPSSYSTCPGLSIKWTGRRLVTNSSTKYAWVSMKARLYKYMYIRITAASTCLGCLVALKTRTVTTSNILQKPTDLELHCLQSRAYLGSA